MDTAEMRWHQNGRFSRVAPKPDHPLPAQLQTFDRVVAKHLQLALLARSGARRERPVSYPELAYDAGTKR